MADHVLTWADLSPAPGINLSQAVDCAAPNPYGIVDVSPETIQWLTSCVVSLVSFLGDIEITAVTTQDIDRWQRNEASRGIKAVTANSYLRGIKVLYGRMQKNGIVHHNPAAHIKPLPQEPPNPKAISKRDYHRIREVTTQARDKAIVDTLWSTGCRLAGIIGMRLDQLEQWTSGGQTCYAVKVIEKGCKSRTVYWKGKQAQSLTDWLEERPLSKSPTIFLTRKKKPYTRSGFSSMMRKLRIEASVHHRPTNPHAFRHAFAIRKLNEGYDLATVSQWMGHSSPEFTAKIYCIRTESELRNRFFSTP